MQNSKDTRNISNISVWLQNKLGSNQNDIWMGNGGSSICSQLNKEVLRNIKEVFTDLQQHVKLKLLLSFFHIPRRLMDEWKAELDEILEVAAQDQELWVSMLSETMKTLPASGSLNSEINDYEQNDSRPIFADMVTELKRLVNNKTNEFRMLPLECQYLNKQALTSLVGNQPAPARHFVLKRKPKSTIFRSELMQKSADLQSSLKKISAPTVPLRSRGLPRKMTDTTPMKGIPSRVPSSGGFKTPTTPQSKGTPVINRGRKDGGVKFLEIEEQPLGYAAMKKRKRQQELEEQQKLAAEKEQNAKDAAANAVTPTTTPDYAAGLVPAVYSQPATPMPSDTASTSLFTSTTQSLTTATAADTPATAPPSEKKATKKNAAAAAAALLSPKRMKFEDDIEEVKETQQPTAARGLPTVKETKASKETKMVKVTRTLPTAASAAAKSVVLTSPQQAPNIAPSYVTIKAVSAPNTNQSLSHLNIPSNTIVRTVQYVTTQAQAGSSTNVVTTKSPTIVSSKPTIITKTSGAGKPTILSNIVLTPNTMRTNVPSTASSGGNTSYVITSPNSKIVQRVVVSSGQNIQLPNTLTRAGQSTIIQPIQQGQKIVQIKTTPTLLGVAQNQNAVQNIPPLISTQQSTLLNLQNPQRKTVTLTSQQPNIGQQTAQQQKLNQIIVPSGVQVKGKTFIVSNQNQNQNLNLGQRNVILQSVGPGGAPVYQQIPLTGNVLRSLADQNQQKSTNQIPALVPTSNLSQTNIPGLVIANQSNQQSQPRLITNIATLQGQQASSNVQIRPVITSGGQQLTLIQRPGQQAQLVQSQLVQQPQTIQKIITRPQIVQQSQQRQQTTLTTPQTSSSGTTIKVATTQNANSGGQRRGLSLSSKHVAVASEMFKKANRVTRLDKALILGFMAGYRDNPRPSPENVITIKLNESKELVKQQDGPAVSMLVETFIRLDYNTGEWKTYKIIRKPQTQQQNDAQAQQQNQSVAT